MSTPDPLTALAARICRHVHPYRWSDLTGGAAAGDWPCSGCQDVAAAGYEHGPTARAETIRAVLHAPLPNDLWNQPNKKQWFVEGVRWAADRLRTPSGEDRG